MSDRRPRLMEDALTHSDLSPAHRVFLVVLTMLPAEYVDGVRRRGSRGMDARGHFALHYDYIARALHTSPENVKRTAHRLAEKGWLSKVHPGTFGRPARWQSLRVRGDRTYLVTADRFVPPYGLGHPPVRGDTQSLLTYRAPDLGDPEPAVGDSPRASDPCPYHERGALPCPPDCRYASSSTEEKAS